MPARSISITVPLPGSRGRWLAVGLAAGLLAAGLASPLFAARPTNAQDGGSTPADHTISVTGTGDVLLQPDVADLRLGVSVTSGSVADARNRAATAMTAVIARLKALGIAEKDIQTSMVSLQPTYDYSANTTPPRVTGFQFANSIAVTVRDLDKLGDAIDQSLAAGATSLDSVSFRVDDQTGAEAQARTAAMADAKAKAQALASAAGVSITGVASISETVAPVPYPVYYGAAAGAAPSKDVATPVQPGTNDVSVTVSVVFLIG
ncbi:MAG TPA: SIMPL domain-containing protein [Candidatus Limnocylindrales bacterium]|nr:SIMPL domain-containing protein [Candidatus Limnocylindrales bacterium]